MPQTIRVKKLPKPNKYRLYASEGYDIYGKRRRFSKTISAKTKAALKKEIAEFQKEVKQKIEQPFEYSKLTVRELIDEVIKDGRIEKNLSENTIKGYRPVYERIKSTIGEVKVKNLSAKIIQHWIDDLEKQETLVSRRNRKNNPSLKPRYYSSKSIKETYNVFHNICRCAVILELLDKNPCHDIKLPINKKKETKILTINNIGIFINNLHLLPMDTKVMIELALFCGLRRGEICALKEDINQKVVLIDRARYKSIHTDEYYTKDPKTRNGIRLIQFPDFLWQDIRDLQEYHKYRAYLLKDNWKASEFLIKTDTGEAINPDMCNDRLQRYLRKINIPKAVTFHGLRHTFVSICNAYGANIEEVSKLVGHSASDITLDTYTHLFSSQSDMLQRSANRFDKLYSALEIKK